MEQPLGYTDRLTPDDYVAKRGRKIKLTERDRVNIEILAQMHDLVPPVTPVNPAIGLSHEDLLLSYGFKYGYQNGCMYGTDSTGRRWQVARQVQVDKTGTKHTGKFYSSIWYILDDDYRRERWKGGKMKSSDFYQLFGFKAPSPTGVTQP